MPAGDSAGRFSHIVGTVGLPKDELVSNIDWWRVVERVPELADQVACQHTTSARGAREAGDKLDDSLHQHGFVVRRPPFDLALNKAEKRFDI